MITTRTSMTLVKPLIANFEHLLLITYEYIKYSLHVVSNIIMDYHNTIAVETMFWELFGNLIFRISHLIISECLLFYPYNVDPKIYCTILW